MDEGLLWVTTLNEAGIYTYQKDHTTIRKTSETETQIKFSITDELDDDIYNSYLTINVELPESWGCSL